MLKSKLIELLRTFSNLEFRSFGKFVCSPFFYKDKAVIKLYNALRTFFPEFNDLRLTREFLYREMYPEKSYSDSHMKYIMSEVFSMAKRYLTYKNFDDDHFDQDLRLLKELNTRNTTKIFEIQLVRLEGRVKNYHQKNEGYFRNIYKMKKLASDYYSYKDRLSKKREHSKVIENIINGFLISLFDIYYEITNDATDYGVNIDLDLISFIESFMAKKKNAIEPVVLLFYNIFMLSYHKKESNYLKLLELKNKYLNFLDDDGKHRIFEAMGNYCINKYQQGEIKYYREAFKIFSDEIAFGVRFSRKEFSEIFFTNKVEIASKVKEFSWAYDFIDKYKDRLNKEIKNDVTNFSYAIIEFESTNYKASLDHLAKINFHHPLLRFRIRNYSLLNYYELDYPERAYLMLDAYRHMLEKDTKTEMSRKERYSGFLSYYQKLLDMRSGSTKIDKDYFKNDIETKAIFMREWLLEKVDQL